MRMLLMERPFVLRLSVFWWYCCLIKVIILAIANYLLGAKGGLIGVGERRIIFGKETGPKIDLLSSTSLVAIPSGF